MWYKAQNITQTQLEPISVDTIVSIIRTSSKLHALVEQIRDAPTKEEKTKLKRAKLPYFVWSKFKQNIRESSKFVSTSYIGFDFDGADNEDDALRFRHHVAKDPRTFLAFLSPSYKGVKVWLKLDEEITDPQEYKTIFSELSKELISTWELGTLIFDSQVKDVSRSCFYSYDPTAYYNPEATPVSASQILRAREGAMLSKSDTPLTYKELYNYSEKGYRDSIEILQELGYVIREERDDLVYMGRINDDGKSSHNALTVFRHVDTSDTYESNTKSGDGRVGVYMFSTSDPRLPASSVRKERGAPATYSPIDLLMMFRFDQDYELNVYLSQNGFSPSTNDTDFKKLSVPQQIIRVLGSKYSFIYDSMARILYVSYYGRKEVPYTDLIDSDIRATLAESKIKGGWRELYMPVIRARMAHIIDPIEDIRNYLEASPPVEYDPIKELVEQIEINYKFFANNMPLHLADDEDYQKLVDKERILHEVNASANDIRKAEIEMDTYVQNKTKRLVDEYVYNGFRKWFMSAVAAWTLDDAVNEIIILFQSKHQGIGKTRFNRRMFPSFVDKRYYSDKLLLNDDFGKDTMMHILSKLVINIDEMETLKGRDLDKFKFLVSATTLSVRVPYGSVVENGRKYTSFIGTTNEETFLGDKTGNRRFLVIPVNRINYMHDVNVDDCFVYAYQQIKKGENYWWEDIETATMVNKRFLWDTYFEESIADYLDLPSSDYIKLSGKDFYRYVFGKEPEHKEWNKFRKTLVGMGFEEVVARSPYYNDGRPYRMYKVTPLRPPKEWGNREFAPDLSIFKIYKEFSNA